MTSVEARLYVERLTILRRFPKGGKVVETLAQQFARHVSDAEHAERVVAAILDECVEWPGPAVIRTTAERTSEIENCDRNVAASQMEQWKREFERDIEPWLCPDCNGYGIVGVADATGKIIRYDACGCPEGDVQWIDPRSGRRCSEGTQGAVLINTPEELDRINAAIANGKPAIPGMVVRKPAHQEKSSSTSSSAA